MYFEAMDANETSCHITDLTHGKPIGKEGTSSSDGSSIAPLNSHASLCEMR
jgi:hypothetical protein